MVLTSEMVRAARALLRWDQSQLASAAGLSLPTIKRLEKAPGAITGRIETYRALERAFTQAGIEFLSERGEGVIRLRGS